MTDRKLYAIVNAGHNAHDDLSYWVDEGVLVEVVPDYKAAYEAFREAIKAHQWTGFDVEDVRKAVDAALQEDTVPDPEPEMWCHTHNQAFIWAGRTTCLGYDAMPIYTGNDCDVRLQEDTK
jgi:hypothetical protein